VVDPHPLYQGMDAACPETASQLLMPHRVAHTKSQSPFPVEHSAHPLSGKHQHMVSYKSPTYLRMQPGR
jgi:hypothetical protein